MIVGGIFEYYGVLGGIAVFLFITFLVEWIFFGSNNN